MSKKERFDGSIDFNRVAEDDYMRRLMNYDRIREAGHEIENFDMFRFDNQQMVPDFYVDESRMDLSIVRDDMREAFRCRLSAWLAVKKTSKVVKLEETVRFKVKFPVTWLDHLLEDHPWLQKVLFRKPEYRIHEEELLVSKSETVDFGAVIPEMEIPEQVLKTGRKTFQVFYRILD